MSRTDQPSHDDSQWGHLMLTRFLIIACCFLTVIGGLSGGIVAQPGDDPTRTANVSGVDTKYGHTPAATEAVTRTQSNDQNYSITITVTDSAGTTDTATTPIMVSNTSTEGDYQLARFDTTGNRAIDRNEAVAAVIAYNTGGTVDDQPVNRDTAVEVIIAYNTN